MAATKYSSGTPGGEYNVLDVAPAGNYYQGPTGPGNALVAGAPGYDNAAGPEPAIGGASTPGLPIAGANGSSLLDATNDYTSPLEMSASVNLNNYNSAGTKTAAIVKVLNTSGQVATPAMTLLFKNPA